MLDKPYKICYNVYVTKRKEFIKKRGMFYDNSKQDNKETVF